MSFEENKVYQPGELDAEMRANDEMRRWMNDMERLNADFDRSNFRSRIMMLAVLVLAAGAVFFTRMDKGQNYDAIADFEPTAENCLAAIDEIAGQINAQIAAAGPECRVVTDDCSLEEGDCPVLMIPACIDQDLLDADAAVSDICIS